MPYLLQLVALTSPTCTVRIIRSSAFREVLSPPLGIEGCTLCRRVVGLLENVHAITSFYRLTFTVSLHVSWLAKGRTAFELCLERFFLFHPRCPAHPVGTSVLVGACTGSYGRGMSYGRGVYGISRVRRDFRAGSDFRAGHVRGLTGNFWAGRVQDLPGGACAGPYGRDVTSGRGVCRISWAGRRFRAGRVRGPSGGT